MKFARRSIPLSALAAVGETDLDDEQAEYLDPILLNSQNLLVMVNDILDLPT